MTRLSSSSPVAATTTSVRADRVAFKQRGLCGVPGDDGGGRFLACALEPALVLLDQGDLVAGLDEDGGEMAADVPGARDEDLHPRIPRNDSKRP